MRSLLIMVRGRHLEFTKSRVRSMKLRLGKFRVCHLKLQNPTLIPNHQICGTLD